MHIPDGFLDARTIAVASTLSVAGIVFAVRDARTQLTPSRVPLVGLSAAFIFAAQMLNFPVAAGTSGHLVGGVLAAVLLGPSAALLAITAVLIVQCLVFADGGILALGANIFNMGIVCAGGGYILYRLIDRMASKVVSPRTALLFAVALAAWGATVLASITCAGQLAWSGIAPWRATFTAMAGVHALIGIGEAVITTLIIAAVSRVQPELIFGVLGKGWRPTHIQPTRPILTGLLVFVGLALFVSPFACRWPDGLERVASVMGFETQTQKSPVLPSPMADYKVPGVRSAPLATILAGTAGAAAVFTGLWMTSRLSLRRSQGAVDVSSTVDSTA